MWQKNTLLSNNTKADVKTEPVEIEAIREFEKKQAEEVPLLLYYMNIFIDRHLLFPNKCLSPNPPMQWLHSFAVVLARAAGPTQDPRKRHSSKKKLVQGVC